MNMKTVNYIEIPLTQEDDANKGKTVWKDGKCVSIDEGKRHVTVYLAHTKGVRMEYGSDGSVEEKDVMTAFPVRVDKPLTRDKLINAAEMAAYGLASAVDVASLNAALARKWRENINDLDVAEHDAFIRWVKTEIDKLGLFVKSSGKVDEEKPTIADLVAVGTAFARSNSTELSDYQKAKAYRLFPTYESLLEKGKQLQVGTEFQYNGEFYRVIQAHTPQADWKPSVEHALYAYISPHEDTKDDPIPYERMMVLEKGKYYTQYGVTYKCVTDSITGYDADLTELMSLLEIVSQEGGAE